MVELPDSGREHRVDQIIAAVVRQQESGKQVDIDRLLREHADVADTLKKYIPGAADKDPVTGRFREQVVDTDRSEGLATWRETSPNPPQFRTVQVPVSEPCEPSRAESVLLSRSDGLPNEYVTGQKPFGRYQIERLLGQGAMGAVYLAHDTQLNRKVALKTPKFDAGSAQRLLARFNREAQSAATLHHPNICQVYDVGQFDGMHFLTMAWIDGQPLSELVSREQPLDQRRTGRLIRRLAKALETAHAAGIVHRDLKPSNIFVDRKGEPIVMDFGLAARLDDATDIQLTRTGTILGTPAYMSPEQIDGEAGPVGPQSDVYSLGVILYQLLSGQLPFTGSPAAVMGRILVAKPRPLEKLRSDLDPRLIAVCNRMMAKPRQKRFESMQAVAAALTQIVRRPRPTEKRNSDEIPNSNDENAQAAAAKTSLRIRTPTKPRRLSQSSERKPRLQTGSDGIGSMALRGMPALAGGAALLLIALGLIFSSRSAKVDSSRPSTAVTENAPAAVTDDESSEETDDRSTEPADDSSTAAIDNRSNAVSDDADRINATTPSDKRENVSTASKDRSSASADLPVVFDLTSVLTDIAGNSSESGQSLQSADLWRIRRAPNVSQSTAVDDWTMSSEIFESYGNEHTWLESTQRYGNFVFTCDYWLNQASNRGKDGSGVVIRTDGVSATGRDPRGVEVDLRGNADPDQGIGTGCFISYETSITNLRGSNDGSSLTETGSPHSGRLMEPLLNRSGWNSLEIRCEGERVYVTVNGELINEGWNLPERDGHICLRSQKAGVGFKDLRIRKLTSVASNRLRP